jgi:hypothetical protein
LAKGTLGHSRKEKQANLLTLCVRCCRFVAFHVCFYVSRQRMDARALTLPVRRQVDRRDSRYAPADSTLQGPPPEEPALRFRC